MNQDLYLGASVLARGQLFRITDGKGTRVQCHAGRLWLTQDGEARDIVLESGDEAVITHDGLSILSALADSRFVLLDETAQSGAVHQARQLAHRVTARLTERRQRLG